jgi:hypothetical protein
VAIIYSSTFGKISGKHGNAVAAVRKKDGVVILKEYRPASNPNTTGQKNQRAKFGFAMKELNCMRKVFAVTYNNQYGINKAVSMALKTCLSGEYPDYNFDYSRLIVALGQSVTTQTTVKTIATFRFEIKWDTLLLYGMSPADNVNLVFLNPQLKVMDFRPSVIAREAGSITIDLPEHMLSSPVHVWMYFSSEKGKITFESQYIGVII